MGKHKKTVQQPGSLLHRKLKLSHHRHSGKRLPHAHTSWGLLMVVVLATILISLFATKVALADDIVQSGNMKVNARVPGPPPSSPAVIETLQDGQIFTSSPITVSGTCPAETMVQIYKNNVFAGSAVCDNEKFSLQIDLLWGQNDLVAKVIDNLDQYGPDSDVVRVTYPIPPTPVSSTPGNSPFKQPSTQALKLPQLVVTTEATYQGVLVGDSFHLSLVITGGQVPYAVFINWGDGHEDLISQRTVGKFSAEHQYKQTGTFDVKVRTADALASQSFIQTSVIVHGEVKVPISTTKFIDNYADPLFFVWPMYTIMFFAISTFWLGERYGLHKINKAVHNSKHAVKKST